MKTIKLGQFAGLRLLARPSAVAGSLLLWAIFGAVGIIWLELPLLQGILGGFIAMLLHWLGELLHQLGHTRAARRTGYPMEGVLFWGLLGMSLYPRDEVALPAAIHIRRALGGAPVSLAIGLIAAGVALLLSDSALEGTLVWWLLLFLALENVFVFGLGAFLPLGFSDGGSIAYWSRRRGGR